MMENSELQSVSLMGIINVTPDSFSDGGHYVKTAAALDHAMKLVAVGAHILDVGGESTRPGAAFVADDQEMDRVLPVIEAIAKRTSIPISIDTRKPAVAKAAVAAGATIWNDVSALTYSDQSLSLAATLGVRIILMHAQGSPETMQDAPTYANVVQEVRDGLRERLEAALRAGVAADRIILDPGIGFGKTLAHNVDLLQNLRTLTALGCPVMLGASRKRFIAGLDREGHAENRIGGSIAAVLTARPQGVTWFRVHDVAETRQALAVWDAISVSPC